MNKTSQESKTSDRYWFKDSKELVAKQSSNFIPSHSLCLDCEDYYDIPPCQTGFTGNSGCFPSLIDLDRN